MLPRMPALQIQYQQRELSLCAACRGKQLHGQANVDSIDNDQRFTERASRHQLRHLRRQAMYGTQEARFSIVTTLQPHVHW